jgi:Arc/MetJ family transcription regulator
MLCAPGVTLGGRAVDNCMHMHENGFMRTTIEMSDEHRAALLEMAARRGLKGFSSLVSDAIESYLKADATRAARRKNLRALKGILSKAEGERLREEAASLRRSWR